MYSNASSASIGTLRTDRTSWRVVVRSVRAASRASGSPRTSCSRIECRFWRARLARCAGLEQRQRQAVRTGALELVALGTDRAATRPRRQCRVGDRRVRGARYRCTAHSAGGSARAIWSSCAPLIHFHRSLSLRSSVAVSVVGPPNGIRTNTPDVSTTPKLTMETAHDNYAVQLERGDE